MSSVTQPSLASRALLSGAVAILAAAWVLPVSGAWKYSPDLGHAWAVPLLMAYLWWERWAERPMLTAATGGKRFGKGWWWLAGALVLAEVPLRLLLTPFPLWPMLLAGYTAIFAGIALLGAWGLAGCAGVRWVRGPLLLLVSVLPVPSMVENAVILPLRTVWASLAAEISNLCGLPALAYGTSVRLGSGWVGIDEACGGIRSLQACVMIALFFGEWYRFRWGRRLALIGVGVAAALLGNFGRVLYLSLRAGAGIRAVESAHDLAGWLAMAASLALTGWLACRWGGYKLPEPRSPAAAAPAASAVPGMSPAIVWLTTLALLFLASDVGTRLWFAHGEEVRRTSITQWSAALPSHHWSFHPAPPLTEDAQAMLRPDIYVAGNWRSTGDLPVSAYYIEWRRGQVARSVPFLHNPTVCLPLAGCELVGALDPISVQWSGGTLPFHAYKFRRAGEEILVAFTIWDPSRGQPLRQPEALHSWRDWWDGQWREVREARQNQPAQLFTIAVPWSVHAAETARQLLEEMVIPAPKT